MKSTIPTDCACCPLNRRTFIARTGLVASGVLGLSQGSGLLSRAADSADIHERTKVRLVFALHGPQQPGPDWPNKGFDFVPIMDRIQNELTGRCPNFEFVRTLATGPEQAKAILGEDQQKGGIDGYVVHQMNCWNQVIQTFADSGKPVLYADFQFGGSGGFLVYNAAILRSANPNVGFVASSKFADLAAAVWCMADAKRPGRARDFAGLTAGVRAQATPKANSRRGVDDDLRCVPTEECLKLMKTSRILSVRDQTSGEEAAIAGVPVQRVAFAELNKAWEQADRDEARAMADRWAQAADRVEGVTRETLETSAAMYLAEKTVMKKYAANAITINCLGGFYGGHIHAYPCLGFHQLLNDGAVGGCECDVRSAAALVIGNLMTGGRPGYISDPVMDAAKREIIYAHCVAANRALGPQGPVNRYEILTHSEDRQGASVRSFLPLDRLTTSLQLDQGRKEILFHQARATGNDPDDRACRTKLCAEPVGDFEKLFTQWDRWGWHRVTFYGDLKQPIYALADALGWKVVEEA
ncbi:MAG: hypothetical protein IT581_20945 [Verrucomicrobiales bacterium]|nr:hypothetical protein [Verrucomicrobiales bacterium]